MAALMIPNEPIFTEASGERLVFDALKNALPSGYVVFHSFKITVIEDGKIVDHEIDFVIYNKDKGIICVEAKNGANISYSLGQWYYSNGKPMDDPFHQVNVNSKWLLKEIKNKIKQGFVDKLLVTRIVCFHGMQRSQIENIQLALNAKNELILTKDEIDCPDKLVEFIENVYKKYYVNKPGQLNNTESNILMKKVLSPQFNLVPNVSFEYQIEDNCLNQFLKEQVNILNFLEEQDFATINGAAGTGKTLIAIEKARRHSESLEKVLFLCFNSKLQEHLKNTYTDDKNMIDYKTIAGYAKELTGNIDYKKAKDKILDLSSNGKFMYKHVIIDEGQDMGIKEIEDSAIIMALQTAVEQNQGTFYCFYDKLQCIQSFRLNTYKLPSFIEEADCRLTLYRNCRNTKNISMTSLRPVKEYDQKILKDNVFGEIPKMCYCNNRHEILQQVDTLIDDYKSLGYKSIAILSCLDTYIKQNTVLPVKELDVRNGSYKNCVVSTCRRFKGLEADAVILVDVTKDLFYGKNSLLFYVGASRAKHNLSIVTMMTEEECNSIMSKNYVLSLKSLPGDSQIVLADALNTAYIPYGE